MNCNPHDAVGRTQILLVTEKDQVCSALLFLIIVMLITAITSKKQGERDKSMFI